MSMSVGGSSLLLYVHATNASSTGRTTNPSLTSANPFAITLFLMKNTRTPARQLTASFTIATISR